MQSSFQSKFPHWCWSFVWESCDEQRVGWWFCHGKGFPVQFPQEQGKGEGKKGGKKNLPVHPALGFVHGSRASKLHRVILAARLLFSCQTSPVAPGSVGLCYDSVLCHNLPFPASWISRTTPHRQPFRRKGTDCWDKVPHRTRWAAGAASWHPRKGTQWLCCFVLPGHCWRRLSRRGVCRLPAAQPIATSACLPSSACLRPAWQQFLLLLQEIPVL